MLDRRRWWNAIETTVFRQQVDQVITPFEKQALFDEQYKTQIAIQGFNSSEVGKIFPHQTRNNLYNLSVTSIIWQVPHKLDILYFIF